MLDFLQAVSIEAGFGKTVELAQQSSQVVPVQKPLFSLRGACQSLSLVHTSGGLFVYFVLFTRKMVTGNIRNSPCSPSSVVGREESQCNNSASECRHSPGVCISEGRHISGILHGTRRDLTLFTIRYQLTVDWKASRNKVEAGASFQEKDLCVCEFLPQFGTGRILT